MKKYRGNPSEAEVYGATVDTWWMNNNVHVMQYTEFAIHVYIVGLMPNGP